MGAGPSAFVALPFSRETRPAGGGTAGRSRSVPAVIEGIGRDVDVDRVIDRPGRSNVPKLDRIAWAVEAPCESSFLPSIAHDEPNRLVLHYVYRVSVGIDPDDLV